MAKKDDSQDSTGLISWIDESDHMIMNIPMTTKNVEKVVANLLHTH